MDNLVAKVDRKNPTGTFLTDLELEHKIYNYNRAMTDLERIEDDILAIKSFLIAQRDGYADTSAEALSKYVEICDNALGLVKKV